MINHSQGRQAGNVAVAAQFGRNRPAAVVQITAVDGVLVKRKANNVSELRTIRWNTQLAIGCPQRIGQGDDVCLSRSIGRSV